MAIYMWREEEAPTTIPLNFNKNWNPTVVELEISTDWTTWTDYTIGDTITLANVWDKVYMRNKSETDTWFTTSNWSYYRFSMSWKIGASGDTTSLLNKNGTTTLSNYCFYGLFNWCTSLTTPPELPATTLADYCYNYMFYWCTNLTTAPELPATTLAYFCYEMMFSWCTSLTTPPELPATTLDSSCYRDMFSWCTSLTTVPELPATTLANSCYRGMFSWCTSLTTLPELPATTLVTYCYYEMFYRCTSIKVSQTQVWEYQIPYRIPTTWTWTSASRARDRMLMDTWWTFTSAPALNTTYYLRNGAIPQVTTPWIYHNETEGLISLSSDWENWITIADKNLWAEIIYRNQDTVTWSNWGKFYQWWNNYGFLRSWAENTSSTQVDTTWYWPWNYYSSDIFIAVSNDWSVNQNDDLRWGVTWTVQAMKWPCDVWFHIPAGTELSNLSSAIAWLFSLSARATAYEKYLFIPRAGQLTWNGALYNTGKWYYWSTTPSDTPTTIWQSKYSYKESDTTLALNTGEVRYKWMSIRPFKNEPVVPTSERTVLYQPN